MKFAMLVFAMVLGAVAQQPQQTSEYAVAVWDRTCGLKAVAMGPHTRMEAPLKHGEPDMKQAKLLGVVADYDNCFRIEVRK